MAQELEPMEENVIPDASYQLRKPQARVKRYFCKHCPEGSISSVGARGVDWRGLTAHMKSKSVKYHDNTRGGALAGFVGKILTFSAPST